MVFTQSTPTPAKANESGRLAASNQEPAASSASLLLPLQTPEPAVVNSMTKIQLQETLLHLIQVKCQEFFCFALNPYSYFAVSTWTPNQLHPSV